MINVPCDDGRIFAFEPESTALLAIDFQRDFLEPHGGCNTNELGTERLATAVPGAMAAVEAARAAGLMIIHTRESYAPDLSDVNPLKKQMGYVGILGPLGRCLIRGEPGCDFVSEMRPRPEELIVDKAGFSAFYGTDLEEKLAAGGISHLIFTGITYQCCVHSTLRDAVDRGYYCLTLDDACAALDPKLESAVRQIIHSEGNLFGWIGESRSLIRALEESVPSGNTGMSPT
jgi:nicotinamidase-related amidase